MSETSDMRFPGRKPYTPFYRCRWCQLFLVLAALMGWLPLKLAGRAAERRLQARLDAYAAQGQPVNVAHLGMVLQSRPAGETNCRLAFAEEFAAFQRFQNTRQYQRQIAGLPFLDEKHPGLVFMDMETLDRSRTFLADKAAWLELLHKFAKCNNWHPESTRQRDAFCLIRLSYQSVLVAGAKLLTLAAAVSAEDGERRQAIAHLVAAKAVTAHLLQEPFLANVTSAIASERAMLRAAERIFDFGLCSAAEIAALRQISQPISDGFLRTGMRIERLSGLDYYYARNEKGYFHESLGLNYLGAMPLYFSCRQVNEFLDLMDAGAAIFDLPAQLRPAAAFALENGTAGYDKEANPLLALVPPVAFMVHSYNSYLQAGAGFRLRLETAAGRLAAADR